jgi:hypothetical protein
MSDQAASARGTGSGADPGDGRLRGARGHARLQVLGGPQVEGAVAHQVEEGDEDDGGEDDDLDEAEGVELA